MIPNSIDHILKPKSSQLMLQNREVSEENLEYVSRKKLEKLKASYQNSLNKCKTPAPKSLSQHFDDKSNYSLKTVKKRNVFRGPGSSHDKLSGEIYSSRLNPYKTTYDDDYNLCRTQKNNLKAKIQDKLQNSTEVLQKKLAYVNGLKKNSVPNLPNFNNGVTYDNFIQKTAEKRERKNKITFLNETPKNDLYYPNEKSNNNNENYNNKLEDYDPNENNYNSDLKENNSQVFPECDTPDWNSISESHWQNLLNSDVFKNYNINPITLIENNPDYFSHLLGFFFIYLNAKIKY